MFRTGVFLCLGWGLGRGIAVTASKAATAGGNASGRWAFSTSRDFLDRLLLFRLLLKSPELRFEGISTGLDGCGGAGMADVRVIGACTDG